jgi:hypothetical protein
VVGRVGDIKSEAAPCQGTNISITCKWEFQRNQSRELRN